MEHREGILDALRSGVGSTPRSETTRRPSAALLTCVDERVVPERVLGCSPGSLYCVRLAGHVVTPEVISSLEIGLELGCGLVFVLGHSDCGAVRLERQRASEHFTILRHIRWATRALPWKASLEEAIEANVIQSILELRRSLRARVEGGILDLATGQVRVLTPR